MKNPKNKEKSERKSLAPFLSDIYLDYEKSGAAQDHSFQKIKYLFNPNLIILQKSQIVNYFFCKIINTYYSCILFKIIFITSHSNIK